MKETHKFSESLLKDDESSSIQYVSSLGGVWSILLFSFFILFQVNLARALYEKGLLRTETPLEPLDDEESCHDEAEL